MYNSKSMLILCISLLFTIAFFSSVINVCHANTYTVGVKAGDWAGYGDVSYEWASNWPGYNQTPFAVNMSYFSGEILGVSNGNVSSRSTTIYKNGTEEVEESWSNIITGEGNLTVAIPANLGPGDKIPGNLTWYTEEPLSLTINGTVTRRYAGANREVNYVNITYPIIYDSTQYGNWNMSFYWDKKTGIMCEELVSYKMNMTQDSTNYSMNVSMLWRLTATNMWPAISSIIWDSTTFNATMSSNSTISNFDFNQPSKTISLNLTGPDGKSGYCNITFPTQLLGGPYTVLINGLAVAPGVTSNATHTSLYVTYTHSERKLEIIGDIVIPEFPTIIAITLLLTMLAVTLLSVKKRLMHQNLSH